MQKFIDYINNFHEWNENEIYFVKNQLQKHTDEVSQTEVEHILDFLYSTKKAYKKLWYKTILEKANKRMKKLQEKEVKDKEIENTDYTVEKDFWDGFRFVKLVSENSYNREGKIMSNCVSSYYGREDDVIYSLRDKRNKPHCTISNNSWQVKWKGNWKIDPKYVDYVVKFLEHLEINVWENEMKNLWYYKLEKIEEWLSCDKMYNWYVYENNLEEIKDKEWDDYFWFWILNIKNLIDFDLNLKFKINLNIKKTVKYIISKFVKKDDSSKLASSGNSSKLASSGDYSKLASSGYSSQLAIEWEKSVWANIWRKWKIKWIIWTRITLAEYNDWECVCVRSEKIDWKKVKENIWYKLEWGEFVECE